jgi:predicted nucleic acid-binding protein
VRLALDANAYGAAARGDPKAVALLRAADRLVIPFVVLAELRAGLQLRRQGTPIPTNDVWIAALVLQHDLVLFTQDAHFARLPQIAQA